ncbi:TPR-like protein [Fomitiporia mediterranea MF3/22]|uniref:TPR-like protein n=1 Tax=Fomitiporia mediterranea (strain MF3/22) TaxID=694068 RepID=UPI000440821D|nr:TPR-like protein [Fomitiporia mediterranea MF3/22]EJD03262.1 TPR-like protein [Fomitiporia mediterranea MF3/22]
MTTFVKSKLKSARDYIGKKNFEKAREAAEEVISYEPDNYNANVFLGLAFLELGQLDQSEQAYIRATQSQPDQALAWQGLVKFYEQTERWDKYAKTLKVLLDLFSKTGDATKCAEQLQKYIEFRRRKGSRKDIADALLLLLPDSPYYLILSTLPPPDPTAPTATTTFATQSAVHNTLPTLEEIVTLTEAEEANVITREVEKRRTRLDAASAGPEALKKQVGLSVWTTSKLPELYNEILNHPNTSDDLRRETEAKLLRYKHRHRCALGLNGPEGKLKAELGSEVQEMVDGIVLLNIPDEFAWSLYVEGKNVDKIEDYGLDILRKYMGLFPDSLLTRAIRGYFLYNNIPLHDEEEEGEEEKDEPDDSDSDPFDHVLEATAGLPDSILAHRMLCDIYVIEEDYQNTIAASEKGLQLIARHRIDTGTDLTQVRKAFNASLATGLVHLFPPKHHARAIRVLDDVLSFEPNNVTCLMGRAYVFQASRRWDDAAELFLNVVNQLPDDVEVGLVAKEEHAWCLVERAEPALDVAVEELQFVLNRIEPLDGYEQRKARVWWRLGQCYWRLGANNRENAYRHFITSLKRSSSFAPAFTSLGFYYLEGAEPPDPARAAKCFQKAFELDAREVDAAQRLAHSFAEDREWDLVEVVARRTIEGEGGLGGGLGDAEATSIAKHKPTNAWAWKALGVVELNRRNYPPAMQAFQVALRSNENDGLSWLRLGEAYMKAGRHAAAVKALNKAHELIPEDWMCVYLLGEVRRQTGQLLQAIETFMQVLEKVPDETTVQLSLAETYVSQGRTELSTGYLARASTSFLLAIMTSLDLIDSSPGFRRLALKTIADALLKLSEFSVFADLELAKSVFARLAVLHKGQSDERLAGIIDYPLVSQSAPIDGTLSLRLAVTTYSLRLSLFSKDEESIGSAWFDLGVGVSRIAASTRTTNVKEKAEKQATEFVRLALLADSGNPTFWNAFGDFNFLSKPMVAQHAYIKALEINSKDVATWTSLGLLYLHNADLELANDVLLKAQTLDPDYTLAWVGQGLVASANGHDGDANALFEHAVGLTADSPAADIEYAYRSFRKLPMLASRSNASTQDALLPLFFSLDRYSRRKADDPSALHLFGLVCERLHLDDLGVKVLSKAIKQLEAIYEETEDSVIERQYAIANTSLARVLLATGKLEAAIETFETAFGLLPTDDPSKEVIALRSLCQFGSGIASFHLGEFDEALVKFETAQEIASANPLIRGQVTVLLAKALWAIGSDAFRDSAKEQLFNCVNQDPNNLTAVVALAAMGLLTGDEALIDAALSEILSLPLDERHRRDPGRDIENLLTNHYLAEGNIQKAQSVVQGTVHAEPSHLGSRKELAIFSISQGRSGIAQALLTSLLNSSDLYNVEGAHEAVRLLAISSIISGIKSPAKAESQKVAQKAIMLAPWDAKNWLSLAYVKNAAAK